MSENFIPSVLYGEGMAVEKRLEPITKALARGRGLDAALKPEPGINSSATIFFERESGEQGFHVGALIAMVFDAWAKNFLKAKDKPKAKEELEAVYADFLSRPWGVLAALPIDSQMMLIDRSTYEVNPKRARMLLEAVKRETPWLKTLDGRFTGTLAREGSLWDIHTTVKFLAARNNLPIPTSWETWNASVKALLKIYQ